MDNENTASQIFGVTQQTNGQDQWHREQERRSFDIIRVKNPTNEDFVVEWGKPATYHRIPANGTADVFRYIARKFRDDISVKIMNDYNQNKHDDEMADRRKKGMQPFESKWHEEQATYQRSDYKRTDDMNEKIKIWSDVWVGLVSEFGKDQPLPGRINETSYSPEVAELLSKLEGRKITDTQVKPIIAEEKIEMTVVPPVLTSKTRTASKEDVLSEVTEK